MEYGKIYDKEGHEIEGARLYLGKDVDGEAEKLIQKGKQQALDSLSTIAKEK